MDAELAEALNEIEGRLGPSLSYLRSDAPSGSPGGVRVRDHGYVRTRHADTVVDRLDQWFASPRSLNLRKSLSHDTPGTERIAFLYFDPITEPEALTAEVSTSSSARIELRNSPMRWTCCGFSSVPSCAGSTADRAGLTGPHPRSWRSTRDARTHASRGLHRRAVPRRRHSPTSDEAAYVEAARAANTLRGYRSDWQEWSAWCGAQGFEPLPASDVAIARYLTFLANHSAKVGTMSRRLSAIRLAHRLRQFPDPTEPAGVVAVWDGIRRTHGAPPDQAEPLMPPQLFHVLDACPLERHWRAGAAPRA